jgi:hypothetical protein
MATELIRIMIFSSEFLNSARKRPQDFTRKRKMPFTELIAFMLNGVKTSIQKKILVYNFHWQGSRDCTYVAAHVKCP